MIQVLCALFLLLDVRFLARFKAPLGIGDISAAPLMALYDDQLAKSVTPISFVVLPSALSLPLLVKYLDRILVYSVVIALVAVLLASQSGSLHFV